MEKALSLDTVLGAKTARLEEVGAIHYKSYGALSDANKKLLRRLIEQMILEKYLVVGNYQVIKMGDISPLKDPETKVLVKITDEDKLPAKQEKAKKKSKGTESLTSAGYRLFDKLRALRLEVARKRISRRISYSMINDTDRYGCKGTFFQTGNVSCFGSGGA